jgi:hypothetical protein
VTVEDLAEKEAVLAANSDAFFTIPHFKGFAAVLIQLEAATLEAVEEALVDGWLARVPEATAKAYLEGRDQTE